MARGLLTVSVIDVILNILLSNYAGDGGLASSGGRNVCSPDRHARMGVVPLAPGWQKMRTNDWMDHAPANRPLHRQA
jgi:hypothetical protein